MLSFLKTKTILWPADPACQNLGRVGGKARNLAILKQKGLNVPPFFVLPVALFRSVFKKRSKNFSDIKKIHERYWRDIIARGLRQKITGAAQKLATEQVYSVRSSAICEDSPLRSMAGQFLTVTNITTFEALIKAIVDVWASIQPIVIPDHHNDCAMAVIVQKMVVADYSGVLFTCDPVTGDRSRMMIELVPGTAEALVAGKAQPERIIISRSNSTIKRSNLQANFLTDHELSSLCHIGLTIEQIFAAPQDIEWAVQNGVFHIIQSRPITSLQSGGCKTVQHQGRVWTNYFFAERFPRGISTLGWSVLQQSFEKNALREPLYFLGFNKLSRARLTTLIDNEPFSDIEAFRHLYSVIPPGLISADKKSAFRISDSESMWVKNALAAVPKLLSRLLFNDLNWFLPYHLCAWNSFLSRYLTKVETLRQSLKSESGFASVWHECEKLTDELLSYHRWSITFADLVFNLLNRLLQHTLNETDITAAALLSRVPGNITTQMNNELAELVKTITANRHGQGVASADITNNHLVRHFIEKYWAYSESLDLARSNWQQNPAFIESIILSGSLPETQHPKLDWQQYYQRIIDRIKAGNSSGMARIKITLLKTTLTYARPLMLLRENQRFYWQQVLGVLRELAVRIGTTLFPENPANIFLCTNSEIKQYLSGHLDDSYFKSKLATITATIPIKNTIGLPDTSNDSLELSGLGVSSGKGAGPAKIVHSLDETRKILPGDIIIASGLDSGWSPILGRVSGLVTEVGGMLSHGSILAREAGKPAVTGISKATVVIQDGDTVSVDGDRGIVRVVKG